MGVPPLAGLGQDFAIFCTRGLGRGLGRGLCFYGATEFFASQKILGPLHSVNGGWGPKNLAPPGAAGELLGDHFLNFFLKNLKNETLVKKSCEENFYKN